MAISSSLSPPAPRWSMSPPTIPRWFTVCGLTRPIRPIRFMPTRPGRQCSPSRWVSPSGRPGGGMGAMPSITGEPSISTEASTLTGRAGRRRGLLGEGERASNGSTTRSTARELPTGTRGRATSILRQTVRPWIAVKVTGVTTSRLQAQPIVPEAGSRPNRIEQPRTERPIDRVPGQRVRTMPLAGRTAARGKHNGTAREAARACPRQNPMAEAAEGHRDLPGAVRPAAAVHLAGAEAADRVREENVFDEL